MNVDRPLTILAVVLLVVIAGCSGVTTDGTTTPEPTTGPTATAPADDATPVGSTTEPLSTTLTDSPTATTGPTDTTSEKPSATAATPSPSPNGTLSIHFINIGQGSSTLVVGPTGETMLVDTGDWRDDGEIVLDYLEQHDIDRIDYLVTSHADADHIGGHAAVIEHFETEGEGIGAVYDPGITSNSQTYQRYLDAIEEHDVTLFETRAGDQIPFDGVDTHVLSPPEGYLASGDRNENSLVIQLGFGNTSFLLPGDGAEASEQYLVDEYGPALNVTVLSAGHHGSKSSSGSEFLDTTTPRIAVISSAYDSQFGHPHDEVLRRFAQRSIETYWTGTHGTVRITSNGSAITVATQNEAPTAPLDVRDGASVTPGSDKELQIRTVVSVTGPTTAPVATDGGTTPTTATATPTTTETSTPTPDPTDTPNEEGTLSVATIHADAEGNDHKNLNDEYIVFENTGDRELDLGDWTVADAADHTYEFPSGFTLDPGAQVTLHTGSGTDTATDLYWGSGSAIWNNGGDTIFVHDDSGDLVLEEEY